MAEPAKEEPRGLSERIENYRKEVQYLVSQGGEQPQFEFKRTASLSRDNLNDRLDFIRFLQGLANADTTGDRCIVVGADPREKKFYPVPDAAAEFDTAKLSQVLSAYLDPLPRFEVFHVATDEGDPFVLIVLNAKQPRPIVVIKQGHTETGKARLEVGEVWVKKNTDLVRARRADLDSMYSVRIEEEAEDRARKRLKHLRELSTTPHPPQPSVRVPAFSLLVGPRNELRLFAEELIATGDLRRFTMLLELARGPLIDGWDNLGARGSGLPADISQFRSNLADFFRDELLPSIQSVVELGLLAIKYEADKSWLSAVIDVLVDAFDASRDLNWLKSPYVTQQPGSLPWWRPAFEVYAGLRTAAIYAVSRKRLWFLGSILPRMVTPISTDDHMRSKEPIIFWPIVVSFDAGELSQGRAPFLWKERIAATWGGYFGPTTKFLESSAQLELLLEFNSYLGNNTLGDPKLQRWLDANPENTSFHYYPDLYSQDLRATVPMAERIYDILSSPDPRFPPYLAVDVRVFDRLFQDTQPYRRLEIYAGFLCHLKNWQASTMLQQRRFPFMFAWEGRLQEIVKEYTERQKPGKTT